MEYLDLLVQTNDINALPQDVRDNFIFHDCIVYVDLTQELINKWTTDIVNTIDEIEDKERRYLETQDEKIFYDSPEQVKAQSYYFSTLCAYSPNQHKPYKLYLDELESKKNGGRLFDGVGNNVNSVGSLTENIYTENDTNNEKEDLSWLDLL